MKKIRKCQKCAQYTMQDIHCGMATKTAHPPKYTIADKYARFRRVAGAGIIEPGTKTRTLV
ncbi:MAG TPA: nucleolar RNA-binding Nop10p family protein [Candidatus Micrarchaeota archaeon]|nr:nucleolar RNA-binding Nop10p family protein [Candidatus Micrarchaeota archaeon]